VSLAIFDVRGARVATLVDGPQPAGTKSVLWNARDDRGHALASGVYLCRLVAGGEQQTRKLVLLK
jgi:flagellar hook assembly protein FlgD